MIAIFELSVGNSPLSIPSDRTILFYGVPAVIVIPAGLAISMVQEKEYKVVLSSNQKTKRNLIDRQLRIDPMKKNKL
jgi:hypothetical protein